MSDKNKKNKIGIACLGLSTLLLTGSTLFFAGQTNNYDVKQDKAERSKYELVEQISSSSQDIQDVLTNDFMAIKTQFANEEISLKSFQKKTNKLTSNENLENLIFSYGSEIDKKDLEQLNEVIDNYYRLGVDARSKSIATSLATSLCGILFATKSKGKLSNYKNSIQESRDRFINYNNYATDKDRNKEIDNDKEL